MVAVYGFAVRHMEGKRPNDLLLASIAAFVEQVNLPFIICGDFNEPPTKLASFDFFRDKGAVEAFQWFEDRFGCKLPPTWAGSTRNDTAIIHPSLIGYIQHMQVLSEHEFDIHTPLQIEFSVSNKIQQKTSWKLPKNWASFAPPAGLIQNFYEPIDFSLAWDSDDEDCSEKIDSILRLWSERVESAVDRSLASLHREDPVQHQYNGLPAAFKGRCSHFDPKEIKPDTPIKFDRHGGYNPPSEVFGLQARLKIRQVRRLKSLFRRLKSIPMYMDDNPQTMKNFSDAIIEWRKIRLAKGYGHSWQNWILAFDAVAPFNLNLPSVEQLELFTEITQIDCNHACYEESRQRSDAFKSKMKIDQEHDFSRMTYRIIKGKDSLVLNEVPVDRQVSYTLLRCKDKKSCIRIGDDLEIPQHAQVHLNQAKIEVVAQVGRKVFFKVLEGSIDTTGFLRLQHTALTPGEITSEFSRFWKPYWQRDAASEQFCSHTWTDFLADLDECNLPLIPQVTLDFLDVRRLYKVIRKLPSGKAAGPCGWNNDEIKCLPRVCIADLAVIFQMVSKHGFGVRMMMAKTVLLSKIPIPTSMHHVRPVTILSSLYRLYTKVIFQTVANVWKQYFPVHISGGLPGRGVKEIAYVQKRQIEEAWKHNRTCGGLTMDLIKAFNTFGRFAVGSIMIRLGVPQVIVDSWIRSLSVMVRYPTLDGHVGHGIHSTTGVPEGCSVSVLAMLATSCYFYHRLANSKLQPYTYADNWSWLAFEQKEHLIAFRKMTIVIERLRLQLDCNKSWHWGTVKSFRQACSDFHSANPAFGEISIKTQTKDLGEMVHYDKSSSLGFIKDKIDEAKTRMKKIEWIPAPLQEKAMIIQSSCWPLALYTSDTTYIGQQHYVGLRRSVLHALVGFWHTSSPFLACRSLSQHICDPFLYTLCLCARTIRRLANLQYEVAQQTIQSIVDYTGPRPYGPASAFKCYLNHVGWSIQSDGTITGPENISCNLFVDSTRFIVWTFNRMWDLHLVLISERKGMGNFYLDTQLGTKQFAMLSDEDQQLVKLNVVGGFQTDKRKAGWSEDVEGSCIFCGQDDTRSHRLLECEYFKDLREQNQEACNILANIREEWVFYRYLDFILRFSCYNIFCQ